MYRLHVERLGHDKFWFPRKRSLSDLAAGSKCFSISLESIRPQHPQLEAEDLNEDGRVLKRNKLRTALTASNRILLLLFSAVEFTDLTLS